MRQRNEQEPGFQVAILGKGQWLLDVAKGSSRVDLVKDRSFGSVDLSKTDFDQNPLFVHELTTMRGTQSKEAQGVGLRLKVHSYLSFSNNYLLRGNLGYVPTEEVTAIADILKKQPSRQIEVQLTDGFSTHNYISMIGPVGIVRIDFKEPGLEVKTKGEQDWEQSKKDTEPGGKNYEKFQEFMASLNIPERTEEQEKEDREFNTVWREMTRQALGPKPVIKDERNRNISLELQGRGMSGTGKSLTRNILDAMISGAYVNTPLAFRRVMNFYADGYAALVNAFCEVEGIEPIKPRVLLGSALIQK